MPNNQNNSNNSKSKIRLEYTEYHSMTRRNSTGQSNYPTIQSGRTTSTNYNNGKKSITNRSYRRIQPSD